MITSITRDSKRSMLVKMKREPKEKVRGERKRSNKRKGRRCGRLERLKDVTRKGEEISKLCQQTTTMKEMVNKTKAEHKARLVV